MEEHFVWVTTRQIKPGALADFERVWRPGAHPEGMLRAYAYWSEDEQEVVGVSFWASKKSCEAWRASEAETRRRAAMAPYSLPSKRRSTGPRAGRAHSLTWQHQQLHPLRPRQNPDRSHRWTGFPRRK
jgi:heme-degrading monooxygenase HmoA